MNLVNWPDLRAACSCVGDTARGGWLDKAVTMQHLAEIYASVGNEPKDRREVTNRDELLEVLRGRERHIYSVYVISYGSGGKIADHSYIVAACQQAGWEVAYFLQADDPGLLVDGTSAGPAYAYLNCCDIETPANFSAAGSSYSRGFAMSIVESGFCLELIANRWGALPRLGRRWPKGSSFISLDLPTRVRWRYGKQGKRTWTTKTIPG